MHKVSVVLSLALMTVLPVAAQSEVKDAVVKHLRTSRDFTVKVAEAMPAADYGFKLTPAQMSFAEQLVHLSEALTYFVSPILGQKPDPPKAKSMNKDDVIAFVKDCYDHAIETVSALTPAQISKTYKGHEERTGTDLLLGMLDHTTHHRASAEMYLRAKGITPPEYEF